VPTQIFSAVLRKYFHGASAEVCLLLARAFYDADQMPQARILNRASCESFVVSDSPIQLGSPEP
jgi:hypothetical protein